MKEKLFSAMAIGFSLSACSTVHIEDGEGASSGNGGGGGGGDPRPIGCAEADTLSLSEVSDGTLFGDVLHVRGSLAGQPAYALLSLAENDAYATARLAGPPIASGSALWSPIGDHQFVRLDGGRLTTIELASDQPIVVADAEVGGTAAEDFMSVMGPFGHELHVCVVPDGSTETTSGFIDLSDPASPGELVEDSLARCGPPELRGVARDGLYVTSGTLDPTWGTDGVRLFDVTLDIVASDHGWNVSGVHGYGNTKEVATDGDLVVATLENPSYVFLYFRDPSAPAEIVYSSFGGGKKKLLDVIDGVAYFGAPSDEGIHIIAFDVVSAMPIPESPIPATPMDATLVGAEGAWGDVRAIASDARRLIVTDAGGAIFVVPLGATGPVLPLTVFDATRCD